MNDETTSHTRVAEGTAKTLAKKGYYNDAAEILKNAVLKKYPPPLFEYTFRWTKLGDTPDE